MDSRGFSNIFLLNKIVYTPPHIPFSSLSFLQVGNLFRVSGVESVHQLLRSVLGTALQLTVLSTRWTVAWISGHEGLIQTTFLCLDIQEEQPIHSTPPVGFLKYHHTAHTFICLMYWFTVTNKLLLSSCMSYFLDIPRRKYDPIHLSAHPCSSDRELDPSWKGDWTLTRWRHDIFSLLDVNDRTAHL